MATVSEPAPPGLTGRVGVAARRHRNRAGAGEAVSRGDRRGVMRGVDLVSEPATSVRPAETWMSASVKLRRRLAEREGHNRAGVAVVQRAVDDVDRDGRIDGVDRDGVGAAPRG